MNIIFSLPCRFLCFFEWPPVRKLHFVLFGYYDFFQEPQTHNARTPLYSETPVSRTNSNLEPINLLIKQAKNTDISNTEITINTPGKTFLHFSFYFQLFSKNIIICIWYLVFCYQNCSDLLWEKNVLVIEKNFWNSRLASNLQKFWDH